MSDTLKDILQSVRDLSECSGGFVTIATVVGAIVLIFYLLKLLLSVLTGELFEQIRPEQSLSSQRTNLVGKELSQGLRLYVLSQLCLRVDYVERYGKWAVISGATDGIGLAMARELARRGHSIVVIGRSEERLANTKLNLGSEPNAGDIVTVKIDLSDSSLENYDRAKHQIDPDNRDIGILINNAGVFPSEFKRFNHFDLDYLRNIVNVNILATVNLTRMLLPGMLERRRGLVVTVSSCSGTLTSPYVSVYGPTKSFINAFSRQLHAEYTAHPIDIINLTTGPVFTKLSSALFPHFGPSVLFPTPEAYARSSMNAISTRIHSFSGSLVHGLMYKLALRLESTGLLHSITWLNNLIKRDLD